MLTRMLTMLTEILGLPDQRSKSIGLRCPIYEIFGYIKVTLTEMLPMLPEALESFDHNSRQY